MRKYCKIFIALFIININKKKSKINPNKNVLL